MKHWMIVVILGAVIFCALSCGAGDPNNGTRVMALGNEGFLIASGDSSVIVDGLYQGLPGYVEPTDEQRRARERAEPPFDAVDLVLVTHHHPDHFDSGVAAAFLEANQRATLISTPMAVELLSGDAERYSVISDRVRAVYPVEGESQHVEVGGIRVEILNLHHGRNRSLPAENLGFVVELNGGRFLHVGDTLATAEELAALGLAQREIDVAFIPYWHLLEPEDARDYLEAIGARTVVAMHLPAADAPPSYLDPAEDLEELIQMVEDAAPGTLVFTNVMEERIIRAGD